MGNVVSCSCPCSCKWDFNQELRYILCPKRHAETLRARMDELNALKEATEGEVDAKVTQEPGMTMHPQVSSWIVSVDDLNNQVDATLKGDFSFCRRLCCCYSYALGDQINQKLEHVKQLKESRQTDIGSNLVMYTSQWTNDCKMLLKAEMRRLKIRKMDLERKVLEQEMVVDHSRRERTNLVKAWMEDVDLLDDEARVLMARIESSVDKNELPAHGQLNDEISRMRGRVRDLSNQLVEELEKKELVLMAPPEPINELPGPLEDPVVGIDKEVEDVLRLLDDDGVELIGIHGMGGAGKTTLVKEVTKKLRSSGDGGSFELVISVVVSQNLDIKKIQGEILTQLGCQRGSRDEQDRANFIWDKLHQKSFLLVLDDVWESFDLSKVGFRSSSKEMKEEKKCKVMITSRSEDACASMVGFIHSLKILKVGFLMEDHAWDLFRRKIRNDLIETEEIRPLAKQIVRMCGGLPLVLKTVASAMAKNKTELDWVHAKSQLDHYSSDIREMEYVFERLKFSFDRLSEELKSCLLYCAMFPEDCHISIDRVIGYWVAEGFLEIKGSFDFDQLRWKARSDIIWRLQESSLLERGWSSDEEYFKLHDAVRDMVIWLGNNGREGNEQYKLLTRAGEHLSSSIMVDENWVGFKMVSLMRNKIQEVLVLSNGISGEAMRMQTLLMDFNSLRHLPENLFPLLSSLRILDLSDTPLEEIPKSIGCLKSLRYLDVSKTHIKELPVEIGNLTNLHTLELNRTSRLSYIPRLAISPLKLLRFLYLDNCPCFKYKEEGKLTLADLNALPRLIDVGLVIYHASDAESLLQCLDTLSMSTSTLWFKNIHDVTINTTKYMHVLEELDIQDCRFLSAKLELNGMHFPKLKKLFLKEIAGLRNIVLTSPMSCFEELEISNCQFEHLAWLQELPELKRLIIHDCSHLRELLPKQESGDDDDEGSSYEPLLSHLVRMELENLPLLESISSGNMLFPSLIKMTVDACPKLRKLPIKLCNSVRTWIVCNADWWTNLEWGDDECNPSRFDPYLDEDSTSSSHEV